MKQGATEDTTKALNTNACAAERAQPALQLGEQTEDDSPPEGGWGWVVCLGVSLVNFLTVGQQNSAGVVYDAMMDEYSTPRGATGTGLNNFLVRKNDNDNLYDFRVSFDNLYTF